MAMIHTAPEALHSDLNRVKLAIVGGWAERDTVLVADKLRDFRIGAIEFLLILGEIDAPARGLCEIVQRLVGLSKALLDERSVLAFLRRKFPALCGFTEVPGK